MTRILFTLLTLVGFALCGPASADNRPFIASYQTADGQLEIVCNTDEYTYTYDVDWDNDGTYDQVGLTGNVTHTYTDGAATHTVAIRGNYPHIKNGKYITDVLQWGDIQWKDFTSAFYDNKVLTGFSTTEAPDLSQVAEMISAFCNATVFNDDLNHWDVSNVENLYGVFNGAKVFNGDITNWNTSNATNMAYMFRNTNDFNQDISSWDVSKVTRMDHMFNEARAFNQNINSWNVGNVTTMSRMFDVAIMFNQDLDNWDVSNVESMSGMFRSTSHFNGNISNWNTSSLGYMEYMFEYADEFNQDLSNWDVSNVYQMNSTFRSADKFKGDISSWDISNVLTMKDMFEYIRIPEANYTAMLEKWGELDLKENVKFDAGDSYYVSEEAVAARNKLINEKKWEITDAGYKGINAPFIAEYHTLGGKMSIPVSNAHDYNYDVDWDNDGTFDVIGATSVLSHDYGDGEEYHTVAIRGQYPKIVNGTAIKDVLQWGGIPLESMEGTFKGNTLLTQFTATDYPDLKKVTSLKETFCSAPNFKGYVGKWEVSTITNMEKLFFKANNFSGGLHQWDVSNVTNMAGMFAYNEKTWHFYIDDWDVSNVEDMSAMFAYTKDFRDDLDEWDVSNVKDMSSMFHGAESFTGDISGWDVSNVTNMSSMFRKNKTFNQDISGWNVSNVTDMSVMFYQNEDFNQDISGWDVSKVTDMSHMFRESKEFNQNIGSWDVSNVTDMTHMFAYAYKFDQDISGWDVSSVTDMQNMFFGKTMTSEVYNTLLINWSELALQSNLQFHAGNSVYTTIEASNARKKLIDTYSWVIFDGGTTLPANPFVATYQTPEKTLEIVVDAGYTYNYDVDWDNDGTFDETGLSGNITHTYTDDATTHTVAIRGDYPRIMNGLIITDVSNWGEIEWKSMKDVFSGNKDIEDFTAENAPNLTKVTDMSGMFWGAENFNGDISGWNVSNVTNMSKLFKDANIFNQDISGWDVSNVTNMSRMFSGTWHFSVDISGWNVSSVTDMSHMFNTAFFNKDISAWDVSNVTNMRSMFYYAAHFNQSLNGWDVSSVTDMSEMFFNSKKFNAAINEWDVSNVTNMKKMFAYSVAFNQDISSWDVSSVSTMQSMFDSSEAFDQPLKDWDVSSVIDMDNMFKSTKAFNQDLNGWDVSKVTTMRSMFFQAEKFNGAIGEWNITAVEDMGHMFAEAAAFNQDLNNWDISSVQGMQYMFEDATVFNGDVSNWSFGPNADLTFMFYNAPAFDRDISTWDVSNVINMSHIFYEGTISMENYEKLLIAWSEQELQSNVNFHAGNSVYFSDAAAEARNKMESDYEWSITDGGRLTLTPSFTLSEDIIATEQILTLTNTSTHSGIPAEEVEVTYDIADGVVVDGDPASDYRIKFTTDGEKEIGISLKYKDYTTEVVKQTVTVSHTPIVDFSVSNTELYVGEEFQLIPQVENTYDDYTTYQWKLGNEEVMTEVSPSLSLNHSGDFDLTLTVTNYGLFTASLTKENYVHVAVGLNENMTDQFKVYPQPAKTTLTIDLLQDGDYNVEIYDLQGNLVKALEMDELGKKIDVSGFSSGTYIIRAINQTSRKACQLKLVVL